MVVMLLSVAMEDASAAKTPPSATAMIETIIPSTRMRRDTMRFRYIFVLLGNAHAILRHQDSAFSCRKKRRVFGGDSCHQVVAILSMFRHPPHRAGQTAPV